jgi:uncharacterized membrane protein YeaQ/YmgE (transglycosylase-associated protein family)
LIGGMVVRCLVGQLVGQYIGQSLSWSVGRSDGFWIVWSIVLLVSQSFDWWVAGFVGGLVGQWYGRLFG